MLAHKKQSSSAKLAKRRSSNAMLALKSTRSSNATLVPKNAKSIVLGNTKTLLKMATVDASSPP